MGKHSQITHTIPELSIITEFWQIYFRHGVSIYRALTFQRGQMEKDAEW